MMSTVKSQESSSGHSDQRSELRLLSAIASIQIELMRHYAVLDYSLGLDSWASLFASTNNSFTSTSFERVSLFLS